ncbi:TPA: hypothetical protein ACLGYO_003490 [Acinetobacter baumannii]|uniref:hypothetical protein n=2 Tax=Acinetobacter baumannii TaxID=470 RepID=UPI0001FFC5E5|nr:hypothetical protein [Acinetobacter baumannii]ADX94359.1 hypothetical protein ABTW07_2p066 [Acinetobacter baumannii TCDC-AB0715]AHX67316.1 hypothetical protein B856_18955 [Acinetobacter baumannii AC30]AKB09320.1 hypothetical protein BL01_p0100 [Acinetobacter baumannii]AOX83362.1 hypothetical protein KAB04_03964 [Acinetobacter baumannii]ARG03914.1 hypothetical protein B7L43_00285 [Acinetobacter baumannii]
MKSELHCFENKIATIFIIAIFLFFIFVFIKHFDHIHAALWPKVSAQGEPCLYKTVGYITSPKDGTSTEIKGWVCPTDKSISSSNR